MKVILPDICTLFRRLFSDYLADGKWEICRDDKDLRENLNSVPKHNKFSETIFGHLDRILREKPNISLIASEAYIMFVHNKTLAWINGKTDQEKSLLVSQARKDVKSARRKFKSRMAEIEKTRRAHLEEKIKKAEEVEKARLKKLEDFTSSILEWGLWQSNAHVDFHLGTVIKTKTDKLSALKAQLNFRKHVLLQKPKNKDVYNFTKVVGKRRINLTVDELAANVKKLIDDALTVTPRSDNQDDEGVPILVGQNIRMYFEGSDGTVKKSWIGHVISTVLILSVEMI